MAISSGLRSIMGVFGPLLSAGIAGGRGAANMWNTYKAAYSNLGRETPPATVQDMNRFVAGLGGILRSMQSLGRASDVTALGPEHWAQPIGYEPSGKDYAVPSMLATFQSFVETPAGTVSRWSSIAYNAVFPQTVGQLRSEAQASAQAALDVAAMEEGEDSPTAGGTVVGTGNMYVTVRGL